MKITYRATKANIATSSINVKKLVKMIDCLFLFNSIDYDVFKDISV
ncbi:hypothetical protein [Bacillus sp. FJAT-45037]|nr:hypothetical protein [Bacillus sp. FJAT-45037]